ncbi:phytoene desaturase family protein [Microbacterium sp. APC 3898]|uniref:Phytoene desaturase family protein n=2 Tax=Planococcus TaxID=1372 RepID=A0ABT7ZK89_9BACL|nr:MULTISPECIES: phytoene desaturase family protein [Terrabacteria group]MBF6633326.1 phytoene desaturase [Planococcus sp. (in: firmicutes)]MBD8014695.1 phytoene desaturase [Planococcus wigleyi]MDN3427566.1 phytoene desaturase family protein [Planococcus sp. APC 4016]MDN3436921.1 phytoene desaturase family protein [Planococcus sp. APC 3900]MDN3499117.1 phytoene desaturase family protein [Microbacterium sp. APC 3898]
MSERMIVIGAGPGGLAAAMLLASKGYQVDVYEKQPWVGGRNAELRLGDFTFDTGPTFLSMLHLVEELFEATGRNLKDYMDAVELDPMYELIFEDQNLVMTRNNQEMKKQINENFKGDGEGYERFMKDTGKKLEALSPILQTKMDSYFRMVQPKVLKALPELEVNKTLYDVLSRYFKDERLKMAFAFQSKYLGMSPWECPGAFSILSYMEHAYGIYHPIGGVNQLSQAMAKVVEELGGRIHTSTGVKKLWIENREVKGVDLENGQRKEADEVIINGDFAHAMNHLVEPGILKKYTPEKLAKKKYSCSTFMLYLGLDKKYDLSHHTIVFSKDYKKNVEEMTKTQILSADPSIYVQNASVTDPTLAPEGKSALYILAPVPNNFSDIGWENEQHAFRELVLDIIEEKTEFKNLRDHIEVEKMLTPMGWQEDYSVYQGATFNLGHQLSQMMVFRPHNKFEELKNCWLVGGGTHPGSGLPTILESARITANGILEQHGKKGIPVLPLPALEGFA